MQILLHSLWSLGLYTKYDGVCVVGEMDDDLLPQ